MLEFTNCSDVCRSGLSRFLDDGYLEFDNVAVLQEIFFISKTGDSVRVYLLHLVSWSIKIFIMKLTDPAESQNLII